MLILGHAIKIAASRADTYKALTDMSVMAAWHLGKVGGAIEPDKVLTLTPKPGLRFGWRTERLEPDRKIVQTCVEGPGTSPGKTLTFTLSDLEDGHTLVEFTEGEWRDDDPHLLFATHIGAKPCTA
jgi:uncharacterized protein YndB with AHSA1/START domain